MIFGYFQNTLAISSGDSSEFDYTSFSVQQLNIMMQKEFSDRWSAFVNIEFVNSFSTSRLFGDMNLEEAWIRYRIGDRLNLKLGLHIPEFNRLNTIKTKMPLLPYIIRPLVYESSLNEDVAIYEYVPDRAYVSLYGAMPLGRLKVDHALYLGNSPNISTDSTPGQSGVDTSMTMLVGGRLGVRSSSIQAGVSGTLDFYDLPSVVSAQIAGTRSDLDEIRRTRFGADLRMMAGPFSLESELIIVRYDENIPEVELNKDFCYATLFFSPGDRLTLYVGYWYSSQHQTGMISKDGGEPKLTRAVLKERIPGFGASYNISDAVVAKAQYGRVDHDINLEQFDPKQFDFSYSGLAVSVMF